MIGVQAEITVKDGANADFEAAVRELEDAVAANEPGCLVYRCFRSDEAANVYVFLEVYADADAIAAHRASEHFRTIGRRMGAFMDGAPRIRRFNSIRLPAGGAA